MPRGHLSPESRLRQQVTRYQTENQKLKELLVLKDQTITTLQKENAALKLKLEDKELQRKTLMEKLYKPNKKESGSQKLGKKHGAQGFHRAKPPDTEVTAEIRLTPIRCPYCKRRDGLGEAKETVIKYTEDIVIVPDKIVKKYIITKHWCGNCKEYVRSDKVPHIERIGMNVMAYILYARYRLRLPYNKIQASLKDLHDFKISEGEIDNQLDNAKELFKDDYESVSELIKISDTVYCDETGWRIKGKNFWIWVFVTDQGIRYVIEDTRGKGVPERVLGDKEDRVLISDFYAAYKNLPGENQYCWVHLLRDSKATESVFYTDLKKIYTKLKQELLQPIVQRKPRRILKLLETIAITEYADNNTERVKQLQNRITRTKNQLITCLKYDGVLPENNTAERALRNHVVMRKIFGGSRSLSGAKTLEVNTSVIDSLLQQNPGKGFFEVIVPKLKEIRGE